MATKIWSKRKMLFPIMALILMVSSYVVLAQPRYGTVYHEVQVVDEEGMDVTSITSVSIYNAGTTTDATIYKDRNLQNAITQPQTSESDNTTLSNGRVSWWGPDQYDFSITNGTTPHTNSGFRNRTASDGRITYPSYLHAASTTIYSDEGTVTFGTSGDWVGQGGDTANRMRWLPATDDSAYHIGSADYTSDFLLFGASAYHMLWDASEYTLEMLDNTTLAVGTGDDWTVSHDGSNTLISGPAFYTGILRHNNDVMYSSTTSGNHMMFDASADQLEFVDTDANFDKEGAIEFMYNDTTPAVDWTIRMDQSTEEQLNFLPAETTEGGAIHIGSSTSGADFRVYGATASNYLDWDASADRLNAYGETIAAIVDGSMDIYAGNTLSLTVNQNHLYMQATGDGSLHAGRVLSITAANTTGAQLHLVSRESIGINAEGNTDIYTGNTLSMTAAQNDVNINALDEHINLNAIGDVTITAGRTLSLTATTSDAAITFRTGSECYKYLTLGFSAASAVDAGAGEGFMVLNGTALTCEGIVAGVTEIGSTRGYVTLSVVGSALRFAFRLPDDFADTGAAEDLLLDLWVNKGEHSAPAVTYQVTIYEYGNTTQVYRDDYITGASADYSGMTSPLAMNGLSTGIGAISGIDSGDTLIVWLEQSTAMNMDVYGMRLKYRTGFKATPAGL